MQEIFPLFNVTILSSDSLEENTAGIYDHNNDLILIDKLIYDHNPYLKNIVILHEMFHATGHSKRTLRLSRIIHHHGSYLTNSKAYRLEECITEICTLIAMKKLGILTPASRKFIERGLFSNYLSDMTIPWKEITAALNCFTDGDINFRIEAGLIKTQLEEKGIRFKDGY